MARSDAVWGIDIGQCALKALRCRPHEDAGRITADAFDYIEYPKILSQPDVDPVALVRDALKQFLSRNSVRGDRVVISVSGQSGLARFIKLPPVETKRIPDIVKYEARQQIPFALEDVIWDFQRMAGGMIIEGFAMETEVGLFAMKRDQVYRALKPYVDAGIEVDTIQLTPLALYNFVAFDQMPDLPPPDEYDPETPPESVVVVSLGTDTTDLVVTNGFRVWQRSIPIGGNHFTKALTKELKLTFASAEHMKRNAAQAADPKAIFQAMRPIFNDLLTEVQRSIGYFTNLDRRAKIGRGMILGNAMKLPGLQRYLAQNMGFELIKLDAFRGLTGAAVVDAPAFKENILAFGVCYGLAVQGLRDAKIKTNLLPREIAQDRMIRAKKPWAVGAAAALLLGFSISYFSHWRAVDSVSLAADYFQPAIQKSESVVKKANGYRTEFDAAKSKYNKTSQVGKGFLQNVAGRDVWMKIMKSINLCLPRNDGERPKDLKKRNEVNIEYIECVHMDNLGDWYAKVKGLEDQAAAKAADGAAPVTTPAPDAAAPAAEPTTPPADGSAPAPTDPSAPAAAAPPPVAPQAEPTGPGWVFELKGHHYHNEKGDAKNQGIQYLRDTLLHNLKQAEVPLPLNERVEGGPSTYPVGKLGISHPVLFDLGAIKWSYKLAVDDVSEETTVEGAAGPGGAGPGGAGPGGAGPGGAGPGGAGPGGAVPGGAGPGGAGGMKPGGAAGAAGSTKMIEAPRYDFIVQFCWQEPVDGPATLAQLGPPSRIAPSAVADEGAADGAGAEAPVDGAAVAEAPGDGAPVDGAPTEEDAAADVAADGGNAAADGGEPSEDDGDMDEAAEGGAEEAADEGAEAAADADNGAANEP